MDGIIPSTSLCVDHRNTWKKHFIFFLKKLAITRKEKKKKVRRFPTKAGNNGEDQARQDVFCDHDDSDNDEASSWLMS